MCSAQLQESLFCSRLMGSYGSVGIGPRIGLDGSAMGGRTMGSSWTDHELWRVITSRSSAHKSLTGEFWQSSGWDRLWNLHVKQRVEKKTDM